MTDHQKVNILLVDDQPAKLLAYEAILAGARREPHPRHLGREALQQLLKNEVAVILVDVCMPELDGFELAAMIRDHPRFERTAIIFISAVQVRCGPPARLRAGRRRLRPRCRSFPEVLRAKVKVFAELYRKTRQLEQLNRRARGARARRAPPSWRNPTPGCWKASNAAVSRSPPARWDPGIGTGSMATGCGTKANTRFSASIHKALR